MCVFTFVVLSLLACPDIAQKAEQNHAHSLNIPKGYSIPKIARSPDGRYGVLVPDRAEFDSYEEQNKLVDLWTGRVLATIHAHSGAIRANHVDIERGNWSRDRTFFLWRVAGKWCPTALVLIK